MSPRPTLRFFSILVFIASAFTLAFLDVATIAPDAQRGAGRVTIGAMVALIGSGYLWFKLRPLKKEADSEGRS